MGFGFVKLKSKLPKNKFFPIFFISALFIGSLCMLKIDYWDLEKTSRQPVRDPAHYNKQNTKKSDLIISVTGGDPTLLYLSDRKGWLFSPKDINEQIINDLKADGAKYLAGSWYVVESYNEFSDKEVKTQLIKLFCYSSTSLDVVKKGCQEKDNSYLIELN